MEYDTNTIKKLVKLSTARQAAEATAFLLEFLETLIPKKDFENFLNELDE